MGRTCDVYGRDEKCKPNFRKKTFGGGGRNHMKDLNIKGNTSELDHKEIEFEGVN
jgi:hypothetical protein